MANQIKLFADDTFGLSDDDIAKINHSIMTLSPELAWQAIKNAILKRQPNFSLHLYLFKKLFPRWPAELDSAPAWSPEKVDESNLAKLMQRAGITNYAQLHAWSAKDYAAFWRIMLEELQIVFRRPPDQIVDLNAGIENPVWLQGAKLNIADSCFTAAPDKAACFFQDKQGNIQSCSYAALNSLSNRVANSLIKLGIKAHDKIAIALPMTVEAVGIYLGILKLGAVAVPIVDSFSAEEMALRLQMTSVKLIFSQDFIWRHAKQLPLYEKLIAAQAPLAVILPSAEKIALTLREDDLRWDDFLVMEDHFNIHPCDPMAACTILFSSGTTGVPKAIPWNHTTAIKAASDAYLHQNIQAGDVLAWPTNLGWMMGPWLIFAALINHAALAIYSDVPTSRDFGEFIQRAKVTMLGVVPSLAASWRSSRCMEGLDWKTIKVLSSTGECSNPEDMFYLMFLAGYKPIIEYCGGTEIGGAYITSTVIEKNYPSVLTTPAMGSDFVLIDEAGQPADCGEVGLIPPALGMSTELLNADQHEVYYANMPRTPEGAILRRHGDQIRRLPSGYYCLLGRIDDTMNLGGIKVSAAEIERVVAGIAGITEAAAVASSQQGPSRLIIYAVASLSVSTAEIKHEMQLRINQHLNPLFKIHDVVFVNELPKTASNKIQRRILRKGG